MRPSPQTPAPLHPEYGPQLQVLQRMRSVGCWATLGSHISFQVLLERSLDRVHLLCTIYSEKLGWKGAWLWPGLLT